MPQLQRHVGRAEPQQSRSREKYERVLDAADRLFALHGVEGTQMTVLAKEANVGVSSLYHLFSDREEIAEGLARRYADALIDQQRPVIVHHLDELESAISQLVDIEYEQHRAHPGYTAIMSAHVLGRTSPILSAVRDAQIEGFSNELRGLGDYSDAVLEAVVTNAVDIGQVSIIQHQSQPGSDPSQINEIKWALISYVCTRLRPTTAPRLFLD